MRGGRCVSHVRSAREQYRNLSSWTRLSLDHEIEVGAGGASRFDIKSTRGGAVVTPSLRRMTSVSNNSSEISRKKSVPRDMASFAGKSFLNFYVFSLFFLSYSIGPCIEILSVLSFNHLSPLWCTGPLSPTPYLTILIPFQKWTTKVRKKCKKYGV